MPPQPSCAASRCPKHRSERIPCLLPLPAPCWPNTGGTPPRAAAQGSYLVHRHVPHLANVILHLLVQLRARSLGGSSGGIRLRGGDDLGHSGAEKTSRLNPRHRPGAAGFLAVFPSCPRVYPLWVPACPPPPPERSGRTHPALTDAGPAARSLPEAAHLDEAGEDAEEPVLAVHRVPHRVPLLLLRIAARRRRVAVHGGPTAARGQRGGGAARAAPAAPQRPLPAGGRCRTQDHNPTVTGSRRDRDRITTGL